ncbi:unnamed protein product [Meloidogyne enterolobii]
MEVRGVPEVTISRGNVVWNCGELKVEPGWGKFVPLLANCPYIFGAQETREKVFKLLFGVNLENIVKGSGLPPETRYLKPEIRHFFAPETLDPE